MIPDGMRRTGDEVDKGEIAVQDERGIDPEDQDACFMKVSR